MHSQGRKEFGRRKEPHRIIIAHGDTVQDFTVRPWLVSSLFVVGLIFSVLYLAATSYLVFRDEIISFSRSEQALMQSDYEDRIAQLRSQIDRIASRQMIDKQAIETHVQHLMRKQADYEAYSNVLEPILSKARKAGLPIRSEINIPIPKAAPWREGKAQPAQIKRPAQVAMASSFRPETYIAGRFEDLTKFGFRSTNSFEKAPPLAVATLPEPQPVATQVASRDEPSIIDAPQTSKSGNTIVKLADAASRLENEMLESKIILQNLLTDLRKKSSRVEKRIANLGVKLGKPSPLMASGGPYIPLTGDFDHDLLAENAEKVEIALDHFEKLKNQVYKLPITHPLPSGRLSSKFGIRRDPFLKRMAMHSGIDIAKQRGAPIRSAGAGKVTHSGSRSGYGLMVEIDHGNGVVSRYAHMSKVLARKGDKVSIGTIIGKVGSSGRSTGPHLHFETRIRGKAVDPNSFLRAGRELRKYF